MKKRRRKEKKRKKKATKPQNNFNSHLAVATIVVLVVADADHVGNAARERRDVGHEPFPDNGVTAAIRDVANVDSKGGGRGGVGDEGIDPLNGGSRRDVVARLGGK